MIEAYIPLYRKYRPQTFQDLVGQGPVAQALTNAIRLGKVAHAYLFCGPRGTGKTSSARILAKSLNCEQGPTATPCGQCPSCEGIASGNALDVIEFDAASNNGVDDARELIESCQFAPLAGRYKIYIIDEVHMLTTQAFNALLKTLEEPPPNVIFIFATTEVHKVLPTIISRCQRFDFQRITTQAIVDRLAHIAQSEGVVVEEEALGVIARHSRGGMRDAVGLLDQVSVLTQGQDEYTITRQDIQQFIGALEEELLVDLADTMAHRQADQLLGQLHTLINRGIEPSQLLKDLIQHFRHLLVVQACQGQAKASDLDIHESYLERLNGQAALFAPEALPQILDRLMAIERQMRHSSQPQLWLEVGLVGIAYREAMVEVHDLAQRLAALEQAMGTGGTVAAPTRPAPPQQTIQQPVQQPAPKPVSQPVQQPVQQPVAAAQPAPKPEPQPIVEPEPSAPQPTMVEEPAPQPVAEEPAPVQQPPQPVAQAPVQEPVQETVQQPGQQPVSQPTLNVETGDDLHQAICNLVSSPPFKELLKQQTFLLSHDDAKVVLGCTSPVWLDKLKNPSKMIHLKKAVEKYFGRPLPVEIVSAKKPEAPSSKAMTPVQRSSPPPAVVEPEPEPVAGMPPEPAVESQEPSIPDLPTLESEAGFEPVTEVVGADSAEFEPNLDEGREHEPPEPVFSPVQEGIPEPEPEPQPQPVISPVLEASVASAIDPHSVPETMIQPTVPLENVEGLELAKRTAIKVLQGRVLE